MYQALIAAPASAELHIFDGAPHAFDLMPDSAGNCKHPVAISRYARSQLPLAGHADAA
jgi:hypothetical protein